MKHVNEAQLKFGGQRVAVWILIFLGLVLSIFAGAMVGNNAVSTVIEVFVIGAAISWVLMAGERWWVVVPAAGAVGGYFYFGHKIYTNEIAFMACLPPPHYRDRGARVGNCEEAALPSIGSGLPPYRLSRRSLDRQQRL